MSKQNSETYYMEEVLTPRERKKLARMNNKQSLHVINSGIHLQAKTERQQELIDSIINNEQTFVTGPAGTGKTYVV